MIFYQLAVGYRSGGDRCVHGVPEHQFDYGSIKAGEDGEMILRLLMDVSYLVGD
jgi:hypothetical protein